VYEGLAAAGVGSAGLRRLPGVATPTCLVLDAPPTRTLLWHVAPEVEVALDDLDWSCLDGAGALHVNGRYGAAAARACRRARRSGALVSLNAGRGDVADGAAELLPYADLAVVSEEWALARTGAHAVEAACRALLDLGPAVVSVTCGAAGSVTAGPGTEPVRVPAASPPAVRTTVGAGDAYHAAFLAAHLSGWAPGTCARRGAAAAAVHCAGGRVPCSG
jgi:sugar/nucleoside kinase (ribokinase family)